MKRCLPLIALLCMSIGMVQAVGIPLINGSFEEPSIGTTPYAMDTIPTGWGIMNYVSGHSYLATDIGAVVIGGGQYLGAQDGTQSLGLYSSSAMDKYLYQNTGVQVQAGVTYTVSAAVIGTYVHVGLGYADTPTGEWNTYGMTVAAGYPGQTWQQYTASGTLEAGDPNVGKYLVVYGRAYSWCGFDNFVVSDNTVVSEPSSMLLLGSGMVGLLGTVVRGRRS